MELTRREFLQWSAVTGATLALAGCAIPPHQALVSQLDLPEYRLPGVARWFAAGCQECSAGCGIAVRVIDGRAKKIEGIPEHPINHGKTCARGQSSLQALYNPDRLNSIMRRDGNSLKAIEVADQNWSDLSKMLGSQLSSGRLLIMTGALHGTEGAIPALLAEKSGGKICVVDSPGSSAQRAAMKALAGKAELPYYPIHEADYVVSFGSDFLIHGNSPVHSAWGYGEFRQGKEKPRGILVTFSPRMNLSAANSDRWVSCRPGTEGWVALGIGNELAKAGKKNWPGWASKISSGEIAKITGVDAEIYGRVAKRLMQARHPLAIAGIENGLYSNGVWSIAVIQMLNHLLTGGYSSFEPDLLTSLAGQKAAPNLFVSAKEAVDEMARGKFETVWVLETNPRYLLPESSNFESAFSKAKSKVVFSPFPNETALLADWVIPTGTWHESWGDRLIHGPFSDSKKTGAIYNLQQPVVSAVVPWRSPGDILLSALRQSSFKNAATAATVHDLLKSRFKDESVWENMLVRGGIWEKSDLGWELYLGNDIHPVNPPPALSSKGKAPEGINPWNRLSKVKIDAPEEPKFSGAGLVLIPFYSLSLGNGSASNRPTLQELPDPLTTVTWTHWIELPVDYCKKNGIERGDAIRVTIGNRSITGPAYPNPGLHPEAVAVPVGQGHSYFGQFADRGENPLSILDPVWQEETGDPVWVSSRAKVEKTGGKMRMTTLDERVDKYPREIMPL